MICCKAEFKALIGRNSRRELDPLFVLTPLDFKGLSDSHLLPQCLETVVLRFRSGSKFCPELNTGPPSLGAWPDPSIAKHYLSKHHPSVWRQYGRLTAPYRLGASVVWTLSPAQASEEEQAASLYFHSYKTLLETNKNSLLSHVEDRKRPACATMAPPPPLPVPLKAHLIICVDSVAPSPHTAGGQN